MKTALKYYLLAILIGGLFSFTKWEKGPVSFHVDLKKSKLRWTGYYLFEFGEHNGTVDLASGDIQVENQMITTGRFIIDMTSIKDLDMAQDNGGKDLQQHLLNKDFFDVDQFPTAQLQIVKTEKIKDASSGGPNYDVFGELTIKGVRNPIKFPALITITENSVEAKARFKFDRTKWDIKYNSGKFFADAGDGAISDAIAIDIELYASK